MGLATIKTFLIIDMLKDRIVLRGSVLTQIHFYDFKYSIFTYTEDVQQTLWLEPPRYHNTGVKQSYSSCMLVVPIVILLFTSKTL